MASKNTSATAEMMKMPARPCVSHGACCAIAVCTGAGVGAGRVMGAAGRAEPTGVGIVTAGKPAAAVGTALAAAVATASSNGLNLETFLLLKNPRCTRARSRVRLARKSVQAGERGAIRSTVYDRRA